MLGVAHAGMAVISTSSEVAAFIPPATIKTAAAILSVRDTDREPGLAGRIADQKHRAGAVKRRGTENIVDAEIAVGRERNAGRVGVALHEWGRGFTDQRGKHALPRRPARVVAATQYQAFSSHLDAAIALDLGPEILDHPDLASGRNSTNEVPIH